MDAHSYLGGRAHSLAALLDLLTVSELVQYLMSIDTGLLVQLLGRLAISRLVGLPKATIRAGARGCLEGTVDATVGRSRWRLLRRSDRWCR